jgi:pimeloyl-ACP methyl ester carboxylesterase
VPAQITFPDASGPVVVTIDDEGAGQAFLLLHGGAGPRSVRGFADLLVDGGYGRAIVPTHPGFEGTARADSLTTVEGLARTYCKLLAQLDLQDVTVLGNSIGGWIAADMVLTDSSRIRRLVIVDGVGIEVPEHPPANVSGLTQPEIAQLSYHNPERFLIDPSALPPEAQAIMAGNRATLALYAGPEMVDPSLRARLKDVAVPTLVVWGESDKIVGADYGRAFADAIPGARFEVVTETGHLPQLENPGKLLELVNEFARTGPAGPASGSS